MTENTAINYVSYWICSDREHSHKLRESLDLQWQRTRSHTDTIRTQGWLVCMVTCVTGMGCGEWQQSSAVRRLPNDELTSNLHSVNCAKVNRAQQWSECYTHFRPSCPAQRVCFRRYCVESRQRKINLFSETRVDDEKSICSRRYLRREKTM